MSLRNLKNGVEEIHKIVEFWKLLSTSQKT